MATLNSKDKDEVITSLTATTLAAASSKGGGNGGGGNDPAGTSTTLTFLEDNHYVLKDTDFGYSGPNKTILAAVKVTALPTAGLLTLNGVAVTAGSAISVADIKAGKLVFTP